MYCYLFLSMLVYCRMIYVAVYTIVIFYKQQLIMTDGENSGFILFRPETNERHSPQGVIQY